MESREAFDLVKPEAKLVRFKLLPGKKEKAEPREVVMVHISCEHMKRVLTVNTHNGF